MEKSQDLEYIGYNALSNVFWNIYISIKIFADKFAKISNKLRFEQYKMVFGERADDIYIATFPKSGTTLMQMIVYQLTSDGNMDFNHIYDVSPWIRNASLKKQKPIELSSPRIIKTHDYYKDFRRKTLGRFIYVYRDGMDVAVSLYHQNKNYNFSKLNFKKYIDNFIKNKEWFRHTQGWFKNKYNHKILYVKYENLINDKRNEIDRIIEFLKLDVDDEAIQRALKYSSFDYMKKFENKFGDQPNDEKKIYDQFIRNGITGEGKNSFDEKQLALFSKLYQRKVKTLEDRVFNDQT